MDSEKKGLKRSADAVGWMDDGNLDNPKEKKEGNQYPFLPFLPDLTTLEKPEPVSMFGAGPWKNYEEFKLVYNYLYVECSIERPHAKALCILDTWINRRPHTVCPAAVRATHALLDALEKNKCERYEKEEKQKFFASAIIRFFNIMASTVKDHTLFSMHATAKKLGLKSSFVDNHYSCASDPLPDFMTLIGKVLYAMEWLQGHYWHPKLVDKKPVMPLNATSLILDDLKYKVSILFEIYDSAFNCFVFGASDIDEANNFLKGYFYNKLRSYAQTFQLFKLREILHSVVGNLAKLFCNAVSLAPAASPINEIYIKGLRKLTFFYEYPWSQKNKSAARVLDAAQCLFRMLSVYGLLNFYFKALLMEHFEYTNICRHMGAAFWAKKLAQGFTLYQLWRTKFKEEVSQFLNFSNK